MTLSGCASLDRALKSGGAALVGAAVVAWAGCGGGSGGPASPSAPTPPPGIDACSVITGGAFPSLAITNGTECSWAGTSVVLLNMRVSERGSAVGQCTGTVIAPRAVLTAAHCIDHPEAAVVGVFTGSGGETKAASFQAHPRYSAGSGAAFDVAVVTMSQDLTPAPIAVLFSRTARAGEPVVVGGWGRDLSGTSTTLRAGVNTISAVGDLYLQTAYSSSTSSVCFGDSGGPLLVSEGGLPAIAGVTSETSFSGYNCANSTSYFTNLRHPDVRSFILGLVPGVAQR